MNTQRQGWTHLQRDKGTGFLEWIEQNRILQKKFNVLAKALKCLLTRNVHTVTDAIDVWKAIHAVRYQLNKQSTYKKAGAANAYAWLYLLERYVRTWFALERLLTENCLPMGKHGVRVLDIGTGPGPSAFAIHDFYNAMVEFAALKQDEMWKQPAEITCVERDCRTNQFRHHLAELIYQYQEGGSKNVLSICNALPDLGKIHPVQERTQRFQYFREVEDEYYDEVSDEWTSELRYSRDEAHDMTQSEYRYRLFVFSNFLTTKEILERYEQNIFDIFHDAHPGTVLLVIGGKSRKYSTIYKYVDKLAAETGFRPTTDSYDTSSENSELSDRIYREEQQFYNYLKNLVPAEYQNDSSLSKIRNHFEYKRDPATDSQIWAYRK